MEYPSAVFRADELPQLKEAQSGIRSVACADCFRIVGTVLEIAEQISPNTNAAGRIICEVCANATRC